MTLSNPTPAERIVSHENKITENIQQIKTNEQLIETQEAEHIDLLAEKTVLDAKSPTFSERFMFDDSLKVEKAAKKQAVEDAREETTELKEDTYQLKEDTHVEQEKLKVAHADEQALHQENIDELEDSKNRSEDRLKRLEDYDEKDPTKAAAQAENIEQEQAVLAKRESDLAQAKESAENAKEAGQARDAKVADDVKEACPLKCKATQLAIKSNNDKRKYQMATELNQSSQTLQVISLSKAAVEKGTREPPVSIISVAITGLCEKGKPSDTAAAADEKILARVRSGEFCPVVKIDKSPLNIVMPGTKGSPLNFQAFCPDPPTGFNWDYLFKNMFMVSKREPAIYTMETEGCDGSYALVSKVEAYPKIKAEIGVSIAYKQTKDITKVPNWEADPKAVDKITDYNKGHRTVECGNWVFAFNMKGSVDQVSLAAQLEHLSPNDLLPKLRKALNLFIFIFDVIRICCDNKMGSNIFEKAAAIADAADKDGPYDETGLVKNDKPGRDSAGKVIDADASGPTGSISINYPKISFGLGYENCEAVGKPTLGSATSLQLKLDPLIGVTGKVDILGALIQIGINGLIPGAALAGKTFVEYIWPILKGLLPEDTEVTKENIDKRNYYLEGGVALVMKVGANITAEGKWTHHNDGENLTSSFVPLPADPVNNPVSGAFSGMAGASLEMHLEGKAYAKGKAWAVTFEAGLIIAVGSAKEIGAAKLEYKVNITEKNEQMMVDGAFEWNGLAIITASYKSAGIGSKDNDDTTKSAQGGRPSAKSKQSETKHTFSEKDLKNQWVLIEPGKTPKDTKPVPLNDYFNS
ncbi:MAG: hypothetical protein HRT55_14415 [Colwellia sp.]|uniref:hypothetical protein n=1 Tax=Colwellia sp. TaxID=56799 RepID=UPI0025C04529|nr:hypothetical protein [Colwellia sp.]NQZ27497.1 hypothetical protein [Colwellia sp.]